MRKYKITLSMLAVILLFTTSLCYGEQNLSLKDNEVDLTFPDGWEVVDGKEVLDGSVGMEDDDLESLPSFSDMICFASKEIDGKKTSLAIGYLYMGYEADSVADPYAYSVDELKQYDASYGSDVYSELFYDASYTKSKESIYKGERNYVKVPLALDNQEKIVYYFPRDMGVTVFVLTSDNGPISKAQIKEAQAIINSLSDDSYYDTFINSYDEDYGDEYYDDYDSSGGGFFSILPALLIAAIVLGTAFVKNRSPGGRTSHKPSANIAGDIKKKLGLPDAADFSQKKPDWPDEVKTEQSKRIQATSFGQEKVSKGADESYLSGLKTMLDSGLMTKNEYNQMIKKYEQRQRGQIK